MKKVLIVAALLLCAAVPAFSSVTDTMLNVGLTGSTSELTLFRNSEFDAKFDIEASADFTMIFDNGPGFDVSITTDFQSDIELGAFYAHKIDVRNSNLGILLSVGPTFNLGGNFAMGIDAMCDLLIDLTSSVYVDLGVGLQMDVFEIVNDKIDTSFNMTIPLPSVGIGVKF